MQKNFFLRICRSVGDYCYVFHRNRIHWYLDCKRISKQEVELPKHKSGSCEVSSQGHYRPQERQRKTRDRADRRKSGWSWTALAFVSHKTINQERTTASVKPHVSLACHRDRYSECWRSGASIHSKECEHQQRMSFVTDKAVWLQPDFLSLLVWKFFCNPSTSPSFLPRDAMLARY